MMAAAMLLSTLSAGARAAELPPGGTFLDDDFSAHEPAIEAIAAAGITKGCNPPLNNLFCPKDPVTRGQMAAFLVRALSLPEATSSPFSDASGVFADAIDRLAAAGITKGCNPPVNNLFCPSDTVTRGQMAAFLAQGTHLAGRELVMPSPTTRLGVSKPAIDAMAAAGITKGCNPPTNDRYCPGNLVTREQMATFLTRGLGLTPIDPPNRPGPPVGNPEGNGYVPDQERAWKMSAIPTYSSATAPRRAARRKLLSMQWRKAG